MKLGSVVFYKHITFFHFDKLESIAIEAPEGISASRNDIKEKRLWGLDLTQFEGSIATLLSKKRGK